MGRYAMPGVWCFKKQLGGCWPGENAPQYVTISLIPEIFNQSLLSPSNMFNAHTHGSFPLRICNFSEASFLALKIKKKMLGTSTTGNLLNLVLWAYWGPDFFCRPEEQDPGPASQIVFLFRSSIRRRDLLNTPRGSACWLEKFACWTNVLTLQKGQNGPLGRVSGIHPSI